VNEKIIQTDSDVSEGIAWLTSKCKVMKGAYAVTGPVPLRRKPDGFAQVVGAIVGQQVSVASADAVISKMTNAGLMQPNAALSARDEDLRAVGLSRQKAGYLRDLASADIDYIALRDLPTDEVLKTLVSVRGIGPWTAEIYAMFSLGRADVFAPGDLALQEAARVLYDLPDRPKEKDFRVMAQDWSPWRSVAARLLWAYYAKLKDREGIR